MIELIPAIDIIDGKCVRLTKGDYGSKKVYDLNPLDFAKEVESLGYRRLHLVDLDGAFGKEDNRTVFKRIIREFDVSAEIGGGIRDAGVIDDLVAAGADRVVLGTKAV